MTTGIPRILLPLLMAVVCLVSGCGQEEQPMPPGASEQDPDQVLIEPRIVIADGNIISSVISAQRIDIYEREDYAVLDDSVVVEFYNDRGDRTSTLNADQGQVWGLTSDNIHSLVATGNVQIESDDRNSSLDAPEIRWLAETNRIYGEGEVTIRTESGFERGTGFEANDDLTEYEFTGPVYGEFSGEEIPDIEEP